RYAIVRGDCFQPLLAACAAQGLDPARYTQGFVVTYNERSFEKRRRERWGQRLGLPVYELRRSDLALFMALECPQCNLLHTWSDLYQVEVVSDDWLQPVAGGEPGRLVITSRFARCCPAVRVLTQLRGRIVDGACPAGPADTLVRLS
ncbi:MAG: hypothetical protein KGJ86_02630, partial [Chloroflexota bacterium]|nr:hypothetical protein [Chloroflexota bacterium]